MSLRLSPIQQQIVQHDAGALLVVAGPGSGKTRVLTERVRHLIEKSDGHFRILALTFTNKAANEMRVRLSEFDDLDNRAFIGTFHSFCIEVLSNRGQAVGVESLPHVFESLQDREQVLLDAARAEPLLATTLREAGANRDQSRLVRTWLEWISEAKNKLVLPEMCDDAVLRAAYEGYDAGLRASGALDFDDLLLLTYRLFTERPRIADFYRRQYRYICIDEAQDINEAQFQLLKALCGDDYNNVMMVGDPRQAIFVWHGADPKFMSRFADEFDAKRIELSENYRSCSAVITAAQAIAPEYVIDAQLPVEGEVDFLIGGDEADEARQVVDRIGELVEHGHPDIEGTLTLERCALLGRTRYVLDDVEADLRTRGWKFFKQLSAQHESESVLMQDFELCLRILSNPSDRLHLRMLLTRWGANQGALSEGGDPFDHLDAHADTLARQVVLRAARALGDQGNVTIPSGLQVLKAHADTALDADDRALVLSDVAVWMKHWDAHVRRRKGGQRGLPAFLGDVALGTTQQPHEGGLALLTVHSAKGMEFDVVGVLGMADGVFPDYRAKGAALQEERRNAFVAFTRARRVLILSYATTRMMPWGDRRSQRPSNYFNQARDAL